MHHAIIVSQSRLKKRIKKNRKGKKRSIKNKNKTRKKEQCLVYWQLLMNNLKETGGNIFDKVNMLD